MQAIILSEAAVAMLRLELKRPRKVRDVDHPAYRELVAAGLMEPVGDGFRLTEEGRAGGAELVEREQGRIERERYAPPDGDLSEAARQLLRACTAAGIPEGNESNRPAFRELVRARIMVPVGSFSRGDEVVFRWTYWGWQKRFELAGC
ncbi:hypothetical protein OJF2_39040 [Aquisphaera giovannonii]|uniref:Uncharacterized protein n=1 Tax=Aquisphaera giovannonii TaxID=406548 RepID=A0A5B9W417_9BACT|nr:hypothetical protein [Aquisphaera giovannonii]QEH35353.1 hypothetical protein OJF2_39040 [Aquisphaera giovannonii]